MQSEERQAIMYPELAVGPEVGFCIRFAESFQRSWHSVGPKKMWWAPKNATTAVLVLVAASTFASSCRPEPQPIAEANSTERAPLICNAPRSKIEPILFHFETNDRRQCEVHGTDLFRSQVPVDVPMGEGCIAPAWSCIVAEGPHGRIAAYAEDTTRAPGTYVTVKRCEECVKINEKYWRSSRNIIVALVTNNWTNEWYLEQ